MIQDISYERNFPIDLYLCYYHPLLGFVLGWPSQYTLLQYIGEAEKQGKDVLTPDDLRVAQVAGKVLFPSDKSLRRFLASYEKPCAIEKTDSVETDCERDALRQLLEQMQAQMQRMELKLAHK